MSRAYKQRLIDNYYDLGGVGTTAELEAMSGADLAQLILSAENSSGVSATGGVKTLGTNTMIGKLATVTADAANTVTVDNINGLFVGQVIDVIASNGITVRADNRTITAIAPGTLTVTYDGADASGTIVAGDFVVVGTPRNNAALSGADLTFTSGQQ